MMEWVWLGVAGIVGGLSFSITMEVFRDRPGWPPENSFLRWELWVHVGLFCVCLGVFSLAMGLLAFLVL